MAVFLVAVSGDALTILLICVDRGLHTPMYFLLSQLSLVDLMHVSTTIPKMATNYLSARRPSPSWAVPPSTSSVCLWVVPSVFC